MQYLPTVYSTVQYTLYVTVKDVNRAVSTNTVHVQYKATGSQCVCTVLNVVEMYNILRMQFSSTYIQYSVKQTSVERVLGVLNILWE